ncbi:hypothetical protein BEP19_04420 [Ammoniphilus oxalaticus]|uniref:HMA domain-containing protein n=1 Tax=Ammoniphilus oxalaticus TaxID=66863 RepID=A0A419SM60_9BACL|nr:heavy metal-associated domain-containing protein [Ammoniphilus oxalaticus]RKD25072.1 hypothetical protein BEP19_04420 [Ammoniphilus oxalaticus]
MKIKKLSIQGMHEQKDVELIKGALLDVWGVRQVEINLPQAEAKVSYNDAAASAIDIEQAVIDQGYALDREEV